MRWFPSSRTEVAGDYADGLRVGLWQEWYPNGQLRSEGSCREGLPHGASRTWREHGSRVAEGAFEDGKQVGTWSAGHPNSVLGARTSYENGLEHGEKTLWHDSGEKLAEGAFRAGEREGRWTFWDAEGNAIEALSGEYRSGERVAESSSRAPRRPALPRAPQPRWYHSLLALVRAPPRGAPAGLPGPDPHAHSPHALPSSPLRSRFVRRALRARSRLL